MAFQLSHLWSKQQILADYLNTAYFGSGAYGVEAAAQDLLRQRPGLEPLRLRRATRRNNDPASLCVTNLTADEAALLAAAVDAPSDYNGLLERPQRRTTAATSCSQDMEQQGYLTRRAARRPTARPRCRRRPTSSRRPRRTTNPSDGYFASWIASQLRQPPAVQAHGASTAAATRSTRRSTPTSRTTAQHDRRHYPAARHRRPVGGARRDHNRHGDVRAMVGGYNYNKDAFNLATAGRAPARLGVQGLRPGGGARGRLQPEHAWSTRRRTPTRPQPPVYRPVRRPQRRGRLRLREDPALGGARRLRQQRLRAPQSLDCPRHRRRRRSPRSPKRFGITTTISLNPSMVIGGLHIGVTPLDMAHAYETIAKDGQPDDRHARPPTPAPAAASTGTQLGGAPSPGETLPGPGRHHVRRPDPSDRVAEPDQRTQHDAGPRLQLRRRPDRDLDDARRARPDRHRRLGRDPRRRRVGQDRARPTTTPTPGSSARSRRSARCRR